MMAHNPILSAERERQLVDQVQRGDRGALGELLGAYHRRIYHLCLRMVAQPEDAAELTQEVLLRAIQHIDGFRGSSRFSTWLIRIAMNLATTHLRRRKVRSTLSLDAPPHADDQASALKSLIASDREPSPDQRVQMNEDADRLTRALADLDPAMRSVILLRDIQQMDHQQMAEVLAVPVGTVKSRLFRARLALRQSLEASPAQRTEIADG